MALKFRKKSKQHLDKQPAEIRDTSSNSEEYFGVIDFPTYFGEGKNSFRIKPRPGSLRPNSRIDIEVLDRNGNPIYHEIPKFTQSDKSRLVSIYVYDGVDEEYETATGTAQVIIRGTSVDGRSIKWVREVEVNTSIQTNSPLVFNSTNLPTGNVSASVQTFVNISQTDGELTQTSQTSDVTYIKSIYGDDVSFEIEDSTLANLEMVGGTIEIDFSSTTLFPQLSGQTQPSSYTSSITEVVTNKIFRVETAVTQSDNRSVGSIHTYETSDNVSATIKYYSTGSNITTENQVAFANITITNVDPIVGRVHSTNTLIKSQGLSNSDFELISTTPVENDEKLQYSVPISTEHLDDPKSIKIQFVNVDGSISSTEIIIENIVFTGGNVYIGGDQSIVTGSLFISNAIGSGLEIGGHSSGFLKSVGFDGQTSASLGKGPGGFIIYSGSSGLQMGEDVLQGVGLQFIGDNDDRHLIFTTHDGGELDIKTDKFFIGTTGSQFISGSDSNIEISSSLFHLDPKNDRLVIGADAIIEADLSANNIRTPATIGGVQSTDLNASSSIKSDGFARFVSASIGGWGITTSSIEGGNLIMRQDGILKTRDYESNVKGWIISSENNGFAEFENVKIRGTLATTTFEKESVNAVGGQLYVANSTTLSGSISSSIQSSTTAVTNSFGTNQNVQQSNTEIFLQEYTSVTPSNQPTMSVSTNVTLEFVGTNPDPDPSATFFTNGTDSVSATLGSISSNVFTFQLSGGVEVAELGGGAITPGDSPGDNFIVHYSSASLSSSIDAKFTNVSPSASQFIVDNVTGFANGEILTLKKVTDTGFATEYVKVDSAERIDGGSDSDLSGYLTVTRSYGEGLTGDSSSLGDLPSVSQSYEEGQVVVSTGKVGSGFIRLNANPNDTSTPYMDIVERTGSGLYDIELKARLGDLSGLADTDLVHGRSNPGFGLATDNVYLQGGIIATFGEIGGFSIDTTTISSSNNNLILKDNGQITGSTVLIDGGKISGSGVVIDVEDFSLNSTNFKVTTDGDITASNALLDGGTIGGFELGSDIISSSNGNLILKSNGHITASEVNLSGDITAEIGRFDDVNVVGVIAKDSSDDYLLETWVTSSSDIDSTYAYGGSLVNVGSTNTEFSYGRFTWTVGGSNLSNTVISASKFSRGIYSTETQLPDPPTFKQWVDVKGGAEGTTGPGVPFGYPEEYGSVDKSVESVAFKIGGIGSSNANWIRSETITLPTSEMSDDTITGYTLQTAIKFGPSFGGFNPTLRVEILKPNNTVLKRTEYTSRNSGEWLNITLPITDALIEVGSNSLNVSNQFRIKLSFYAGSSSGGGSVQYIRFTELRILKSPSLETVFAKGLQFEQSSLQPTKLGTAHHGNFIPGRDNTYDLGQVQDITKGREAARWDDVYATNGTIQTSDESEKTNITSSDLGLSFVNDLRPVSYKWVGKTRTHYGLIAQEVSSSLGMFGKTTDDFAGVTTGSLMGLRYTEMLSPMIKAIQELSDEVTQLKLQLSQSQG